MLEAKQRKMRKSNSPTSRASNDMNFTERYNKRLREPIAAYKNYQASKSPRQKSTKLTRAVSSIISKDVSRAADRFGNKYEIGNQGDQKSLTKIFKDHRQD
jgi:hypothetical protein